MNKKPSNMTPEERNLWIQHRKRELEKTIGDLDSLKKLEEEKFKQELRELRIIRKSRGFGDTVEKTIKKITGGKVKACGGCNKRRNALNKMFPYKEDPSPQREDPGLE